MSDGQESYFTAHSCLIICSGITKQENQQSSALLCLNSVTIPLNKAQYHTIHREKNLRHRPDYSQCVEKKQSVTGWFPSQRVSNATSGKVWMHLSPLAQDNNTHPAYMVCGIKSCYSTIPLTLWKTKPAKSLEEHYRLYISITVTSHSKVLWRFTPCTFSLQWHHTRKFCRALYLVHKHYSDIIPWSFVGLYPLNTSITLTWHHGIV